MIDSGKLTAASRPFTFNGVEYQISPLKDVQFDELTNWVRQRHIRAASEATKGLGESERQEIIGVALKQSYEIEWGNSFGLKIIDSLDGLSQLLHHSASAKHPDITPVVAREILQSVPRLERNAKSIEFFTAFLELNEVIPKNAEAPLAEQATGQ